jgi:DNA mismatch repair ATPase MutS
MLFLLQSIRKNVQTLERAVWLACQVQSGIRELLAGWHPLTATLVECFRPNCTTIGTNEGRVAVVTGPNCSGKSVYLEQVGIIVYLAHIGCFVPAAHAKVGLTDRIVTRMVCDEGHNALFAKDLVQLSNILKASTPRSLVLIDEFGKVRTLLE